MASCISICAIICVLITTVATIIAFSTPNWIEFRGNGDLLCKCPLTCDCGLWLHCTGGGLAKSGSLDNCRWFFSDDFFIERDLPDWFKAVQGLMSCAIAATLLSLIIGLFSLCCKCKSCRLHQAAGAFVNFAFLLVAVAVCVFGAKAYMDHQAVVITQQGSTDPIYGWSFWVAVGAAGMALISSILYFCVGRSDDYYI